MYQIPAEKICLVFIRMERNLTIQWSLQCMSFFEDKRKQLVNEKENLVRELGPIVF
jgi:hypothetical protein